ncbi:MAG: hypothetical protein AB8G15_21035, partial [Saprospiraceae bacterium]
KIAMKNKIAKLILLLVLFQINCSSPSKLYEKRKYKQAYKKALRALKKDKDPAVNRKILRESLQKIITEETVKKEQLLATTTLKDKDKVLRINKKLSEKFVESRKYLNTEFDLAKESVLQESKQLRFEILNTYLSDAKNLLVDVETFGDKIKAKTAYHKLKKAQEYTDNHSSEIDSLISVSYEAAIIIYTISAEASFSFSCNWDIDRKFDNITSGSSKFRKVYYEPSGSIPNTDCAIRIRFGSLSIDEDEDEKEETYSKEIVVGTETITNASGEEEEIDKIEEISGTVIKTTIKKTAEWSVSVSVTKSTNNCRVGSNSFREEIEDEIEEFRVEGDERAVPDQYHSPRKQELMSDEKMEEILIDRFYNLVCGHIF